MTKEEIAQLREHVSCSTVLLQAGFTKDLKESSKKAVKYRDQTRIIIVTHNDMGWFDPRSDKKGDVFSLLQEIYNLTFPQALEKAVSFAGSSISEPAFKKETSRQNKVPVLSIDERWRKRTVPHPQSDTWRYLTDIRHIPEFILNKVIEEGVIKEGPRGSIWAAHKTLTNEIVGWEERGAEWRGFANEGEKRHFRFGSIPFKRLCVTESAIDAMSLAAIERLLPETLYLSTGGGWSNLLSHDFVALMTVTKALVCAAFDADDQGDVFTERLFKMATEHHCCFMRLIPRTKDWNEDLV